MKRVLLGVVILGFAGIAMNAFSQENNSPGIKIIEPSNKSKYDITSQVHYRIKISDKEDGESEYGEIATNEVFLEVRYLPDAANVPATNTTDSNGLVTMKKSNCFNCHAFNGKLIAPSFYDITKRYPPTSSNVGLLTKRIREGSGGLWGTASMPSHAELTHQQAEEIVNWILKNGEDPNLNYYTGIEGTFKMKKPDPAGKKGVYVLSATYSDHGGLTSKDVIMVMVK